MELSKSISRKIKQVKDNNLSILNLNGNSGYENNLKLDRIPEEIFELENLEVLLLRNNTLTSISPEIKKLCNLKVLDLGENRLEKLPETMSDLKNITSLKIDTNYLTKIPDWLIEFENLIELDLSANYFLQVPETLVKLDKLTSIGLGGLNLTSVPEWLYKFPNLIQLDLSGNALTNLPPWIVQFQFLEELRLAINKLTNLPHDFARLQNLTKLSLWLNTFKQLPESVTKLKKLTTLILGGNYLSDLPDSFSKLQNLTILDLGNNLFNNVPDCIYNLSSLNYLSFNNADGWLWRNRINGDFVSHNSLTVMSPQITRLTNLEKLTLLDNPIQFPPPEVVKKGFKSIKEYFTQIESNGVDFLFEAKLIIVGEGGAGKTTLLRKIENPAYQLQEDEASTQGIDVVNWEFKLENGRKFQANIWDFGGQEIYHATHQFFLTKRSLYILVADTRKDDTDFYYWINIVDLLSDGSPILIVKNEKQDRLREINERQLRAQFTNFKATLATNLATNRGLDQIIDEIKHYISRLPHIGTALPKTWVKVREELEKDVRNHITIEEYFEICQKNDFTENRHQLQLSGYLHDLGVCLHFQNDPILKKIIILKPKWGTDAVYKVLDNKTVIGNLGCFTRSDLIDIWSSPEYSEMHDELLQLMINFKLCYKIPDSTECYIAPQLLTENQPIYNWDDKDNLILRFTYDFMPKGIITQFIVAMHPFIADQNCVWKSGMVLEKDDTKAEIIEFYGKREIQIRVMGKFKKNLMTIIIYELDKIHRSYNRLQFKKLIPCNCTTCRNTLKPHFYSFDVLQKFVGDKQHKIQCQQSYEMVNVFGLIDDIVNIAAYFDENGENTIINTPIDKLQELPTKQSRGEEMKKESIKPISYNPKSAWANGSFYLFTFLSIIFALTFVAGKLSLLPLILIISAGILFVPLVGVFQLKQDQKISEKSFNKLLPLVIKQLPVVASFSKNNCSENDLA